MKKRLLLSLLATAAVAGSSAYAQTQGYQDVVRDTRGALVNDSRGHCVYTVWLTKGNNCGATPRAAAEPSAIQNYLVFFDFNRATLTPEARNILKTVAQSAKDPAVTRITLTGHADRSGSTKYNLALSKKRADAVARELVRLGVSKRHIVTYAKGESEPLVPTKDGVREPQNRRVEIVYTY